jgi:hypothetical protein
MGIMPQAGRRLAGGSRRQARCTWENRVRPARLRMRSQEARQDSSMMMFFRRSMFFSQHSFVRYFVRPCLFLCVWCLC